MLTRFSNLADANSAFLLTHVTLFCQQIALGIWKNAKAVYISNRQPFFKKDEVLL